MTDFLHGVETITISSGSKPVRDVKSAVIGIVGTAPIHHVAVADRSVNQNKMLLNDLHDAKYFGPNVSGYSLPQALAQIRAELGGTVIAVNVFDPATHKTTQAAADRTLTSTALTAKMALPHADIISVVVKVTGGAGAALIEGTDYTIDRVTGVISKVAGGALAAAAGANVGYDRGNPGAIDGDDIIGGVGGSGARTGMQCWRDSMSERGFYPKILIAPGYSSLESVVGALATIADKTRCRGVALIDAPLGTTFDEAIEGRGPDGEINFNVADPRVWPLFPHVTINGVSRPLSSTAAGVMAYTDAQLGFWKSPSNKPIRGIQGLEVPVSAAVNDTLCEANVLNGNGIGTVFNAFGTGYRLWGNRSSAFPGSSAMETFIKIQRTLDQIDEALEMATLAYLDDDVTQALIDAVLGDVNAYMRRLVTRKALVEGSRVEFQKPKNPSEELALGHVTFTKILCGTPPAERMTFETLIDINLLSASLK